MEVTINGLKIQVEGEADSQVFFDAETNTLKIQVKEKVIETIKVLKPQTKTVFVPQVQMVPQPYPVPVKPWQPYQPWPGWGNWRHCTSGTVITTTTTGSKI